MGQLDRHGHAAFCDLLHRPDVSRIADPAHRREYPLHPVLVLHAGESQGELCARRLEGGSVEDSR